MSRFFNGFNNYGAAFDHPSFTLPNGDWCMAAWIKLASNAGLGTNEIFYIGRQLRIRMLIRESGNTFPNTLQVNVIVAGIQLRALVAIPTTPGLDRDWQFVYAQRDSNFLTLSRNGVEIGRSPTEIFQSTSGKGNPPETMNPDSTIVVGAVGPLDSGFFHGNIAHIFKINRNLTTTEELLLASGIDSRLVMPTQMVNVTSWLVPFDANDDIVNILEPQYVPGAHSGFFMIGAERGEKSPVQSPYQDQIF